MWTSIKDIAGFLLLIILVGASMFAFYMVGIVLVILVIAFFVYGLIKADKYTELDD